MIQISYRKLAALCIASPGITFEMPDGTVILNVFHRTSGKSGRRNLRFLTVLCQYPAPATPNCPLGYLVERPDFDKTVTILD